MPYFPRHAAAWLCASLVAAAATAAPVSSAGSARFRIDVRDDAVYGISYGALAKAGLAGQPASSSLALTNRGTPVPLWVEDGGDGRFGPGDRLEFVGRHLAGTVTYRDPYSAFNVYVLDVEAAAPAATAATTTDEAAAGAVAAAAVTTPALLSGQHLERDVLLLRYNGEQDHQQELWYWAKLTQIDAQPFRQTLDLADLDVASARPVEVRLRLRGWSRPFAKPQPATPDHRVEVSFDGKPLGSGEWNNVDGAYDLQLPALAAASLTAGPHELTVKVPKRPGTGGNPLVDVLVVDWIEVLFPRIPKLRAQQQRLELAGDSPHLRLLAPGHQRVVLYTETGVRRVGRAGDGGSFGFGAVGAGGLDLVVDGKLATPAAVERDEPSTLLANDRQADYLVVTTPQLRPALAPLLELRRAQGLAVAVADVQDVYDEFSHGIPHPEALRAFVKHAYEQWWRPAPRFLLLVGDASWDLGEHPDEDHYPDAVYNPGHGTAFAHIGSTAYAPDQRLHRNLIPTWSSNTYDGHAASDNWFVSIDGDDEKPELAVGRFPVVTAAEVAAIVDKIVRYEKAPPPGDWRSQVLWISNEDVGFQTMSDRLATHLAEQGFAAEKVYAKAGVTASEADQAAIRDALGRGSLLVHFVGHGGRFIWRTGPPDWTKHRDLFNLDDVDKLAPNEKLPVVLA
ncbi:MAG TPA: C25 family cysteine peptidase, partial [Thermoanaerobaculia bacterium]|nr:C25 family cysteine peptidase [Thermoanaerobaculia bacterium]